MQLSKAELGRLTPSLCMNPLHSPFMVSQGKSPLGALCYLSVHHANIQCIVPIFCAACHLLWQRATFLCIALPLGSTCHLLVHRATFCGIVPTFCALCHLLVHCVNFLLSPIAKKSPKQDGFSKLLPLNHSKHGMKANVY